MSSRSRSSGVGGGRSGRSGSLRGRGTRTAADEEIVRRIRYDAARKRGVKRYSNRGLMPPPAFTRRDYHGEAALERLSPDHLRRILRGQVSLFDWSRSTSLARTFSPRVLESQIDARKELEKSLKSTCEEFIMSITKLVVDPMLSFVTKVTAVKVALSSGSQGQKLDSVLAKPLKTQAFASPDKVAELVQKVGAAIQEDLPKVMIKMRLYLQNPSTRLILFKPIKTNIVEAHIQLQSLVKSEYSADEIQSMGMLPISDLQAQLDSLM